MLIADRLDVESTHIDDKPAKPPGDRRPQHGRVGWPFKRQVGRRHRNIGGYYGRRTTLQVRTAVPVSVNDIVK